MKSYTVVQSERGDQYFVIDGKQRIIKVFYQRILAVEHADYLEEFGGEK